MPVYIPHLSPIIWFDLFLVLIFILMIMVLSFESYNPSLIKY
uniref:ATP synthase F0 subunit 8 n=1 Tax=Celleporella hyalina TaxID=60593 RepID=I6Q037_9BILA|nr:ATP synthase F0 subunit 8 [Celleporella hyalina]